MYKVKTSILLMLFGLGSISAACNKNKEKEDSETEAFDRKAMLSNITTQYILPAYANYDSKTSNLLQAVADFNNSDNINALNELRNNLVATANAWQSIAFLEFGPAENIGLRSQSNLYPCDTNQINSNISNNNYNLAAASNFSAKGIQAIDYLLNQPSQTDTNLVLTFVNNANASQYLLTLATELNSNANTVKVAWDSYATTFIENNSNNAQGSAVSDLVNALSAHYETFVRKGKLGIPLGVFNGFSQTTLPEKAELAYGGQSFEMLYTAIDAIESLINGLSFETKINGLGLDDYMNFVAAKNGNENLSTSLSAQLEIIKDHANNYMNSNMAEAIANQKTSLDDMYQDMQKLVPLIKVDLTSALGILITYQDNDGD
ncbi:hypothetical protein DNU06_11940 [Putridiphycobacter roseus]|uniref:Imelysin-like domain-containing protein n=1 Tax=Putridiphycobacter roseus TaxID=2219161 RepID=A0A2W1NPL0_9FLAO|nr:imelysin family protein [Putridiphycobacter roseus]PZE16558.1 hypothetical protein DNU06_11940 [Putridiphycobacter roseus]